MLCNAKTLFLNHIKAWCLPYINATVKPTFARDKKTKSYLKMKTESLEIIKQQLSELEKKMLLEIKKWEPEFNNIHPLQLPAT